MTGEIPRTKEIFLALIDLEPHERAARLDGLCGGDASLRKEVEALLASHHDSAEFLERPAFLPEGRADSASRLELGTNVGPYLLREVLGEGGMGVVYLAEQSEPLRRRVALKVLKPGMDSQRVMARFEAERQALAMMAHPGIARVHDAGTTDQGYPYFVMEYVDGESLVEYCDSRALGIRQRIGLFLEVIEAVRHAHQKGILHRDLKPSNLLVTEQSGRPAPKVIDFGVAKALSESVELGGGLTVEGTVIGTPEYMSPEQADRAENAIDTRSDIYSLGVVLYELLTATLPVDIRGVARSGFTAIRERLLEETVPRASTRASRPNADALRGDLDWILARTLEKDPERRYASVSELAADLRRHLADQPVLAGPPTGVYRVRKFIARNRVKVVASAAVLLALLVGLTLSLWGWVQSRRAAEELLRLSDRVLVVRHLAEAETLPFAAPADVPALEALEGELELLVEHLPTFEASLTAVRERALEPLPVEDGGEWRFVETEDIWKHGLLSELISLIGDHEKNKPERSALERARRRRRWAAESAATTVEAFFDEWAAASESIADAWECPQYAGLALPPQLGLVPLGRDELSGLWEFWHPLTGEEPWQADDGTWIVGEETGLVFVLIPAGSFTMGARPPRSGESPETPNVSRWAIDGEAPVHRVSIGEPFFLSKYEMTQGQWSRVTWHNPSVYGPDTRDPTLEFDLSHPVETVTKEQALGLMTRIGLTLPTEAQWEYAARAGTSSAFCCGNQVGCLEEFGNVRGREILRTTMANLVGRVTEPWDDGWPMHAPVGVFVANDFGLYDVHGNVFEWILEGPSSYAAPCDPKDGRRLDPRMIPVSLARGGSAWWPAGAARVSNRADAPPEAATGENGLRPSRPVVFPAP